MADQQSALSLVGSKVLVCSFPCLDSVIIYEQSHSIEKECLKHQMFHKKTITAIINILTSELVKLKMIIYKSLILLLIISWNQSDAKVINSRIVIG